MTTQQLEAIIRHGQNLTKLFHLDPETTDPVKLCKQLRRLEVKANRDAVDYCNAHISGYEYDTREAATLKALDKILTFSTHGIPVFVNGDPRGCALKIDDDYTRAYNRIHPGSRIAQDWGGYGLIAPEIDRDGRM
jgi:hypothetical protein